MTLQTYLTTQIEILDTHTHTHVLGHTIEPHERTSLIDLSER